jgi:abequosyltransferase
MTRPVLTIAIPTYGRAACLKELLSFLADQVKNEPRVELLISDNASSDETPSTVQDFVSRGLPVRYMRNSENIGADANFLQCFEQARGKYVWLFSDDDLIIPGALAKILGYCESAEYDLIWVSHYSFKNVHTPRAVTPGRNAIEVADAKTYAKRIHVFFTFISGNIINKDTVLKAGPKPFSELVGTSLVQLGWAYTALSRFTRGLYVREKLVAVRLNNTGGYKLFQVFGAILVKITRDWLPSSEVQGIILNGTLQRFWPLMLLEYKKNAELFTQEARPDQALTPIFKSNSRYWIFAYPVIVLPSLPARVWVLAVRLFNALDKALGYPVIQWGVGANDSNRTSDQSARPGSAAAGGH